MCSLILLLHWSSPVSAHNPRLPQCYCGPCKPTLVFLLGIRRRYASVLTSGHPDLCPAVSGPAPRLRLADGPHGCAGRLEVWHGGRWGSVCDDAWDLRDAAVACRELSCGGALAAPGGAFFGEGAGPIVLDDLRCRGNETALRFCPARPWGQHDCHHREDAGAVCDGKGVWYE